MKNSYIISIFAFMLIFASGCTPFVSPCQVADENTNVRLPWLEGTWVRAVVGKDGSGAYIKPAEAAAGAEMSAQKSGGKEYFEASISFDEAKKKYAVKMLFISGAHKTEVLVWGYAYCAAGGKIFLSVGPEKIDVPATEGMAPEIAGYTHFSVPAYYVLEVSQLQNSGAICAGNIDVEGVAQNAQKMRQIKDVNELRAILSGGRVKELDNQSAVLVKKPE